MEKLTERILEILRDDSSLIAISKPTLPRLAREISQAVKDSDLVKDIAIEFAKYRADYLEKLEFPIPNFPGDEAVFQHFINQYKK